MPEIYKIMYVALAAAFVILVFTKTGLREKARDFFDETGLSLLADMLDCDLCLSFWMTVIISIFIGCAVEDDSFMYIPVFATPITRFLL